MQRQLPRHISQFPHPGPQAPKIHPRPSPRPVYPGVAQKPRVRRPSEQSSLPTTPLTPTAISKRAAKAARVYTERKQLLYATYSQLLKHASMILIFRHDNLSVAALDRIRVAINAVPIPPPSSTPTPSQHSAPPLSDPATTSSSALSIQQPLVDPTTEQAKLLILRTGIFGALAKAHPLKRQLHPYTVGQKAFLYTPSLSPKYLTALLRAVNRAVNRESKAELRDKPTKQPTLELLGGIMEGQRVVEPQVVRQIGKLPELEQLRGQIVGILEQQGRSLLGVLSQAGGGGLVRTLMGLEEGLKKDQEETAT